MALDAAVGSNLDATVVELRKTSVLLQKAEEHATVLRAYFAALAGLAADTESQAIGDKAAGLAQRIAALSNSLVPSLPGTAIRQFSALAVAAYRNEQLRRHIEQNYMSIGNAIVLQRVVLEQMRKTEESDWITAEVRGARPQYPALRARRLPGSEPVAAAARLEAAPDDRAADDPGALAKLEQSVDFLDRIATSFRLLQK